MESDGVKKFAVISAYEKCGTIPSDYDAQLAKCGECGATVCGDCRNFDAEDMLGKAICDVCFDRMYERCPECRGSGEGDADPSGIGTTSCQVCDRNGFIAKAVIS